MCGYTLRLAQRLAEGNTMIQAKDCTEALIIGASGAIQGVKRYEIAEAIGEHCQAQRLKMRGNEYFFLLRLAISAYDATLKYPRLRAA